MSETKKMRDSETNLQALKDIIREFRDERDWKQFHTPKDLSEAIVIEAGELLENFLWKQNVQIQAEWEGNKEFQKAIRYEYADIVIFALQLALILDLDITSAVLEKLKVAAKRYPVARAKGNATKYTKLQRDRGETY